MIRGRGRGGLRGRGRGRISGDERKPLEKKDIEQRQRRRSSSQSGKTEKTEKLFGIRRTAQAEEDAIKDTIKAFNRGKSSYVYGKLCKIAKIVPTIYTRRDLEVLDVVEINSSQDPDINDPSTLKGTVWDSNMGPSIFSKNCGGKCREGAECGGHIGYIDLGNNPNRDDYIEPYIDPAAGEVLQAVINLVCPACGLPVITEAELEANGLSKAPLMRRVKEMEKINAPRMKKSLIRCIAENVNYYDVRSPLVGEEKQGLELCSKAMTPCKYDKLSNRLRNNSKEISNTEIRRILLSISPESAKLLGFKFKPVELLKSFVIVIPPSMREANIKGYEDKQTDYLGQEFKAIIKARNEIRAMKRGAAKEKAVRDLHDRILHIFSSSKGKTNKKPGTQELEGLKERLSGKEGHIRHTMMGKRLNRTYRAVITPNTSLLFFYIGIPEVICDNNYVMEYITTHTIDAINQMIKDGKVKYYYPASGYYKRKYYDINNAMKNKNFKLRYGDAVARKLQDGDYNINGRNPTIHAPGLMGFRIKRVIGNTIQLHPSYCSPLNADFDGDEMHGYIPQEIMAVAELRYVGNVVTDIINPENSFNCMGLIMDTITAVALMTGSSDFGYYEIPKDEYKKFRNLLVWRKDLATLKTRLKLHNISPYSTRGVLSMLFPENYSYTAKGNDDSIIRIQDGILISGTLSKKNIGVARNSIIHQLYIYYGDYRAAYFINDASRVANFWITHFRSFTLGISDAQINNENVKAAASATLARLRQIIERIDIKTPDKVEEDRIEGEIISLLQQRGEAFAGKLTRDVLSGDNAFRATISSGAKGDIFHAAQMVAFLGQQFFLGQRLRKDITNGTRVFVYTHPDDRSPEASGFVSESLGEGLDPMSQASHHKATRATLIDTTTKTAEAGEDHHLKDKALIDFCVHYDGTTRDCNGIIIQFIAGYNGLNPRHTIQIESRKSHVFGFFCNPDSVISNINSQIRLARQKA